MFVVLDIQNSIIILPDSTIFFFFKQLIMWHFFFSVSLDTEVEMAHSKIYIDLSSKHMLSDN